MMQGRFNDSKPVHRTKGEAGAQRKRPSRSFGKSGFFTPSHGPMMRVLIRPHFLIRHPFHEVEKRRRSEMPFPGAGHKRSPHCVAMIPARDSAE